MEANASDAPAVTPEEKPASVTTKKKAASFTPDEKPASVTTEKKKETKPPKNPGRIAAGKKLAEHNRRVRAAKKNKPLLLLQQHQKQRAHLLIHPLRNKTRAITGYLILGVGGLIISALGVYYQREAIMASFANRAGKNSTQKKEPNSEEDFSPPPTKTLKRPTIRKMD